MRASCRKRLARVFTIASLLWIGVPLVHAAGLAWDPSPGPDVAGYEVHIGYASGVYEHSIDVGPTTTIPLPALAAGRAHYLAVAAYDFDRVRSALSNEIVLTREQVDALLPEGDFTAFPLVGVAPHTVRFTPFATGALLWLRWDFGDGNAFIPDAPTPLINMPYTYERPGTYSVTFTLAGPGGARSVHRNALIRVVDPADSEGCPCSLWGGAVPRVDDDGAQAPVTVGMRFAASRDGYITALRFYKSPANRGPHVGDLWTEHGEQLGSVTFSGATASGWQQADFTTPLRIQANTVYVASYLAPAGHVAKDDGTFLKRVDAGPLHAPASRASAANGVHGPGLPRTFPIAGEKQSNYWVDVVFVPAD